jgi:hypothetical protein
LWCWVGWPCHSQNIYRNREVTTGLTSFHAPSNGAVTISLRVIQISDFILPTFTTRQRTFASLTAMECNEPDGAAKAADRSKLEDKHARAWAEALARLDPNNPPHDVPLDRWQRFIEDCECFHRLGWANRAEALGWGPLDLFGCDRERPFSPLRPYGTALDHPGSQVSGTQGRDRHGRHANRKLTDLPACAHRS